MSPSARIPRAEADMNRTLIRTSLLIAFAVELSLAPISTRAEAHCPGNVSNMQPPLVAGALLVIQEGD